MLLVEWNEGLTVCCDSRAQWQPSSSSTSNPCAGPRAAASPAMAAEGHWATRVSSLTSTSRRSAGARTVAYLTYVYTYPHTRWDTGIDKSYRRTRVTASTSRAYLQHHSHWNQRMIRRLCHLRKSGTCTARLVPRSHISRTLASRLSRDRRSVGRICTNYITSSVLWNPYLVSRLAATPRNRALCSAICCLTALYSAARLFHRCCYPRLQL